MKKITSVLTHMTLKDLMLRIRKAKDADKRMRWHIIYTTAAHPRDSRVIALQLGCSRRLVASAVSEYNRLGEKAFQGKGSGSNRSNCYMTKEEEAIFLRPFVDNAKKGLLGTIKDIQLAFEKKIGKNVPVSTITRLLKRNGWRKITTRPFHPSKNEERQEAFKKNSQIWFPLW